MDLKKCIILIFGLLLLFSLVGCGNRHKSKAHNEMNAACTELDCLSSINWKIRLQGQSFPDKTRIDVNGTTVLNECVSKQKYSIDRSADPEMLVLENYYIPKNGDLKIDLYDLGSDCGIENKIISNENVPFLFEKSETGSEILIML